MKSSFSKFFFVLRKRKYFFVFPLLIIFLPSVILSFALTEKKEKERVERGKELEAKIDVLEAGIENLKTILSEADRKLEKFEGVTLEDLAKDAESNRSELDRVRSRLNEVMVSIEKCRKEKEEIESQLFAEKQGYVSERVTELKRRRREEVAKLKKLQKTFTDEYPKVKTAKENIEKIDEKVEIERNAILESEIVRENPLYRELKQRLLHINRQLASLKSEKREVEKLVSQCEKRGEEISTSEKEIQRLKTRRVTIGGNYEVFRRKLNKARTSCETEKSGTRDVKQGFLPTMDSLRFILPGLFFGLFLGLGVAFLRERTNRSFDDLEEVRGCLDIPVLGTIPQIITKEDRKRVLKDKIFDWTIFCLSVFIILGTFIFIRSIFL